MVLRTQEEQDSIYGNNSNYQNKPWKSVHQFWRGVDLRNNDMKPGMADDLAEVLNKIPYDESRPEKKSCIVHDVGRGDHIHIQVKG